MNEIQRLEMLSESLRNEIDELQSLLEHSDSMLLKAKRATFQRQFSNIISNLEGVNDAIYEAYEDLNCMDISKIQEGYDAMYEVLQEKLSDEEKLDMKFRYGIEF